MSQGCLGENKKKLPSVKMAWIKKRQGHYERPFDSMERFHKAYGAIGHSFDREHFSLTCAVQVRFMKALTDPAKALSQTWLAMRYWYPQIAAYADEDTYVYEIPNAESLDSWLKTTFIVEPSNTTTSDLQASFKPQKLATLHYLPHSSEILLHTAHWRIDGIGLLHFFDAFFESLENPAEIKFGDEVKNLTQPLDSVVSASTAKTSHSEKVATARLMEFLTNLPSIGLPINSPQVPGATRRFMIYLDPDVSSKITEQCKAQRISVTAAIHAAIVCATQQMADVSREAEKYTTFTFFDLRKHLPEAYQKRSHAFSLYHIGLPATLTPSTFAENAQRLKEIYARPFSTPEEDIFAFLPYYVDQVAGMVSQPPPPGTLPATEGNLSSLGVIDKYLKSRYEDTEILDFWMGVEMLTPIPMVHAWTRQGRMNFNLSYNESYYSADTASHFMRKAVDILCDSLDIPRSMLN